jgi:Pyridine nucleotide-disulphide oxidoreductase, dimerisation domain
MKALVSARDDRILGFTMIGAEAGEVLATVQTAMLAGLPYSKLPDAVLTHPTMVEPRPSFLECAASSCREGRVSVAVVGEAAGDPVRLIGHRFHNPCDGMRNARLKREDAFSHAMIIVSSAMVSSS